MHEIHVEAEQVVKAPMDKVFSAVTDYEAAPRWSKFYTSVKVMSRNGDQAELEVETHIFGAREKGPSTAIATPPDRVELKGNPKEFVRDAVVTLEPAPEGTKLTYRADAALNGVVATIITPFEKHRLESLARDEVKSLAHYIESLGDAPQHH